MLEEGALFPPFSLSDQNGSVVTNGDLIGHKSVIYFYPKDDTPGCTKEACEFRDLASTVAGAKLYGVSPDSARAHQKFIKKFELNFPLLVDQDHQLADACGIWVEKTFMGRKYMGVERTTYLVDAEGKVEKVWRKVSVPGHAEEVVSSI